MLKEKLTSDTMIAGFLIPSMVKDLEGKEDQKSDIMKWLAAAVGFGGSLGGNVPVAGLYISTRAGILGGIFSTVADKTAQKKSTRLLSPLPCREDCGYATGSQWMSLRDGEEYCFYIMRYKPFGGNYGESWTEAEEEVYTNMAKYDLGNRDSYYRAVLDCALSADKQLQVDNLGFNNIPVCFFDLEAFFIDHNDTLECTSNLINKVCPPVKATAIA
ncbi:hypothetical protein QL093DRAFT_2102050 [Fusarium oxysporum]|nr:hypothetical protein QL093DRAFT_2102050 [Fusarium oxysporum]